MIKGVRDVYYNVTNMEASVKFYTEVLNMSVVFGSDYWTTLNAGNVNIGLHWSEGNDIPPIPKDAHGPHAGATLTLVSTDIAEDRAILEQAGAAILGEADEPWGHMLVFEDLDGNVLKLMNPKQ